jgi:hypothetical protein
MHRQSIFMLSLLLSLLVPCKVTAQPRNSQTQADINAQADEQFRRGRLEQDRGNCQKALEYFRASHALKPSKRTLLGMGRCEKKLGQLAKALQHLEELLPQLGTGDERRQIVREDLAELRAKVPWLRILLTTNAPRSTVVTYDDSELEPTMIGTDIPVDPGKHVLVVEADGRPNRRYEVMIEEGKRQTVRVEPGTLPLPKSALVDDSSRTSRRTGGFVVGGVGFAGIIAGAITGGIALHDRSTAEKTCPTHVGCSQDIVDLANHGRTLTWISTAAFAVGVVGLGFGVPLVVTSRTPDKGPMLGFTWSPNGARIGLNATF